jgi:hypothetical protein
MNSIKEKMLNRYNQAIVAGSALLVSGYSNATETSDIDTLFGSVDLGGVSAAVVTMGGTVLGIYLAYKGIVLVKRAINKA